jgi:uncharacterized protein (TIGR04255 family)
MTSMAQPVRRMYRKPPVSQVVCEFQFVGASAWDWTVLGLIYQKISDRFPEKRQEQGFQIRIAPGEQKVEQTLPSTLTKMQFLNDSKSTMVQIGPDLLAVNIMTAYPGWESFRNLIQEQFGIYREIAHPVSFKRIGLRYINRFEFSQNRIETTDYFNYYPKLPPSLEQTHGPFSMQVLHTYDDERDTLNLRIGTEVPPTPNVVIILDLDYVLMDVARVKLDEAESWIDQAHDRIESMFEACITDKARELFEVVQ